MKRHGGYFESQACSNHHQCNIEQRRRIDGIRAIHREHDLVQVCRAGQSIQIAETKQKESRRHSAEEIVLQSAFGALARLLCEGCQNVESQAEQLKTNEDHQQILRSRNQQPARSSHQV